MPHDGVLGPMLYRLYTNYMPEIVNSYVFRASIDSAVDATTRLQIAKTTKSSKKVAFWTFIWLMKLMKLKLFTAISKSDKLLEQST